MPVDQHVSEWARDLVSRLSTAAVVHPDHALAKRTTMRVGGRADLYVEPASESDLSATLLFAQERGIPVTPLGRGSNLLIRDGGIRGIVISLSQPAFSQLVIEGTRLRCGAGVRLKAVSVEARRAGLTGLEFLEGIPGSVGGALRMNAGAMGAWMFHVVESVRMMNRSGVARDLPVAEVPSQYRSCPILKTEIALGAVLVGSAAPAPEVAERMAKYSAKRWESQPSQPSAGCIFKNPQTIPAGKLIDELGLKGTRLGGAMVSDIHGNFIVNMGEATASDVLKLIELVRQKAKSQRGIDLETEVEILGED